MPTKKIGNIQSASKVADEEGRLYHIGLKKGELAEFIILVGDQDRPEKAIEYLSEVTLDTRTREFRTITGKTKNGLDISIMSTGIGTDNMEIAVVEISQICINPTLIRGGSCGALQEFIELGDLVISTGSVRIESTSTFFVHEGYPAIAHYETIMALSETAQRNMFNYHIGLTASAAGFYGAQGRAVKGLYVRNPNLSEELAKMNVYNFEMETSTLFNLGQVMKIRTGAVCGVYALRIQDKFIPVELKNKTEKSVLKTAIEACEILNKMDKIKKISNKKHWLPSLNL